MTVPVAVSFVAGNVTVACWPSWRPAASASAMFAVTSSSLGLAMVMKPLPAEVADDDAALDVLDVPDVPAPDVLLVELDELPDDWPTLPLTASTTPAIGAFSTVPSRVRVAVSTCTWAESTSERAWAICAGVCGCRSASAVSCASRTWPWAVTMACWSLSTVAFWACSAEVIASWSFCRRRSRCPRRC